MTLYRKFCLIVVFLSSLNFCFAQQQQLLTYDIKSAEELKDFFRKTPDRKPLMCAHRGGAMLGFPENSIETFTHTLSKMYTFFEVDPRLTKDSVVVLMHDVTVDRTTNGSGRISDYTYEEVQQLYLRDPTGKLTKFKVPTLEEAIKWSKDKTILMIDKKDVPLEMLLEIITRLKAESHVLLSVQDPKDAEFYYKHNKNIMFEAFIKNEKHLAAFENTGIPWENFVAYVSQPKRKELYDALHARGMMIIVYTTPVLEKIADTKKRIASYQKVMSEGVDILLSDRIFEVWEAIKVFEPSSSQKLKYFRE